MERDDYEESCDDYYIDPDPFFPDDDDDLEEVICYLNGEPLTKYDLWQMGLAE